MADRAGASVRRSRQWSALRSAAFLVRFPSRSPDYRNRGNSSSPCVCTTSKALLPSASPIPTRRALGGSKSRIPIIRRKRGEATCSIGGGKEPTPRRCCDRPTFSAAIFVGALAESDRQCRGGPYPLARQSADRCRAFSRHGGRPPAMVPPRTGLFLPGANGFFPITTRATHAVTLLSWEWRCLLSLPRWETYSFRRLRTMACRPGRSARRRGTGRMEGHRQGHCRLLQGGQSGGALRSGSIIHDRRPTEGR